MARGRVLAQGHRKSVVHDGYQAIESMGCLQPCVGLQLVLLRSPAER
jgi:hypothetical protein